MNGKFLSRGKREDNGEWVTGYYVKLLEHHIIFDLDGDVDYIIPETIGRCTGLTDKNDTLIFEGDRVRVPMYKVGETLNYMTGFVEWINGAFSVTWDDTQFGRHFVGYLENVEIIGNIHDNPELIGGNENET